MHAKVLVVFLLLMMLLLLFFVTYGMETKLSYFAFASRQKCDRIQIQKIVEACGNYLSTPMKMICALRS